MSSARLIGAFSWAILPRYRRLARENLSAVFAKEMSSSEIRRLTFRHFTTLGANGICSFKVAALSQKAILRIAPFVNSEVVERNILRGRGVVLAISHMGSWELYAQAAFQRPETRFGTIYQALRNPHLDDLINRDRQKGVETFDRKKGFQAAIALVAKAWMHGRVGGPKRGQRGNLDAVFQPLMFDVTSGGRSGDPDQFCGRAGRNLYLRLRPLARRVWGRDPV